MFSGLHALNTDIVLLKVPDFACVLVRYPDVREQAAISLRSLPQNVIAKFGPSIAIRVGDDNEAVRKAVAETLGALPTPHHLFTLIQRHASQNEEASFCGGDVVQPKVTALQYQIESQCDALSQVAAAYAETLATIVRIASTSSLPAAQRAEAQDLFARSTHSLRSASEFVATQVCFHVFRFEKGIDFESLQSHRILSEV